MNPDFDDCFPNWTDIDDNQAEMQTVVSIYPNPVTDRSTLEITNVVDELDAIKIMDLQGRIIANYKLCDNNQVIIQKNNFNKGIYFIEVMGKTGRSGISKMIVN